MAYRTSENHRDARNSYWYNEKTAELISWIQSTSTRLPSGDVLGTAGGEKLFIVISGDRTFDKRRRRRRGLLAFSELEDLEHMEVRTIRRVQREVRRNGAEKFFFNRIGNPPGTRAGKDVRAPSTSEAPWRGGLEGATLLP